MFRTCECVNIKHKEARRCKNTPTKICTTCNVHLCSGCAKNHHAHDTITELGDS